MGITSKNATFISPKTTLETMYFELFLKNLTNKLKKKLIIIFVLMKQINFTNIFLLHATSFIIEEYYQAMHV